MKQVRIILTAVVLIAIGLTPDTGAAQKRQRDLITREELESSAHRDHDLHRAVRALRPHFLAPPRGNRTLGNAPPGPVLLYVNGIQQGDVESLKMIPVSQVEEVRYLEPSKAQMDLGPKNSGGAVLVKLRQRLQSSDDPLPPQPRDTTRAFRSVNPTV